jgi:hypothetical protein
MGTSLCGEVRLILSEKVDEAKDSMKSPKGYRGIANFPVERGADVNATGVYPCRFPSHLHPNF